MLILLAFVAVLGGCTGGSADQAKIENDPQLKNLQDRIDREKAITADVKRRQEEGRGR
ncbi:MAG: hypothetical protein ACO1SV_01575 [Fimbriimonas sp.]